MVILALVLAWKLHVNFESACEQNTKDLLRRFKGGE